MLQAVEGHTRHSMAKGWTLPTLLHPSDPSMTMEVTGMYHYCCFIDAASCVTQCSERDKVFAALQTGSYTCC
jgi:hypothetical protein